MYGYMVKDYSERDGVHCRTIFSYLDYFQLFGLFSVIWTIFSYLDYFQLFGLFSVIWTIFSYLDYFQLFGLFSVIWTIFSYLDYFQLGQIRSECLTCTFRTSCCSTRLSQAQVQAFASSSCQGQGKEGGGSKGGTACTGGNQRVQAIPQTGQCMP